MNQVIQSLVQSPYVRTMSAIPSKSEELVHGVENFLPPLSRTKVSVPPKIGRASQDVYQFDIPRRDYLDRLELVFAAKSPRSSTIMLNGAAISSSESINAEANANPITLVSNHHTNVIQRIELYSKNRFIESLDPDAIQHELYCQGKQLPEHLQGVAGERIEYMFHNEGPFPSKGRPITADATLSQFCSAVFVLPLPFCSVSMLRKNLQTSFLETLTVSVETKFSNLFQLNSDSSAGYSMELVCYYHQFHPNVETVIRNANYKPGIPATLPWWEYVPVLNQIQSSSKLIQYNLDSDSVCSELLIIPQQKTNAPKTVTYAWSQMNPYFVLTANGEILCETDALDTVQDANYKFNEHDQLLAKDSKSDGPIVIRFGMRFGETFTGGLALASLNNVILSIYPSRANYLSSAATNEFPTVIDAIFDMKVVMKRHYMLRIDSDTGVVSRAIES